MKKVFSMKSVSAAVVAGIFVLASCSKSDNPVVSSTNATSVNSESSTDSYTNETADISNSVTTNAGNSTLGGSSRAESVTIPAATLKRWDKRLACATVTITRTGTKEAPAGTITITWGGTACTDTTGVQRSGSIIITYVGYWFQKGSTRTITYDNYMRGGITVAGTLTRKTLTTLSPSDTSSSTLSVQFRDSLVNGQVTFANGKSVTRTKTVTVQWDILKFGAIYLPVDYKHLQGGSAYGTLESGASYTMTITTDIVYNFDCLLGKNFIPVSGTKTLVITPAGGTPTTFTINYDGDNGKCNNNKVSVTVNGKSETITVNPSGD
jgi:hypothetical protein